MAAGMNRPQLFKFLCCFKDKCFLQGKTAVLAFSENGIVGCFLRRGARAANYTKTKQNVIGKQFQTLTTALITLCTSL